MLHERRRPLIRQTVAKRTRWKSSDDAAGFGPDPRRVAGSFGVRAAAAHTEEVMRAALVMSSVIALVLVVVWGLQRRLVYFPSGSVDSPAAAGLPGARDVVLESSDGLKLRGWFIPAAVADRHMAVLVANGNAGNRSGRAPLARALSERGLAVLLLDYRGYGGNPGSPSERGLARDVRAAYRFLVDEAGVPSDRLLYYGESLGAAVVVELATEHRPAGSCCARRSSTSRRSGRFITRIFRSSSSSKTGFRWPTNWLQ